MTGPKTQKNLAKKLFGQPNFKAPEGGEVKRYRDYERAPHIVRFTIPSKLIITPEEADQAVGLKEEHFAKGLGLKAMRDIKERLFLGTGLWKYANAVAINPY